MSVEPVAWQHRVWFPDRDRWSEWREGHANQIYANRFEERPLFVTPPSLQSVLGEDKLVSCAVCNEQKPTPLRRDDMGGYVCLACVDQYITDLTADRDKFRAIAQNTLEDTRLVNAGGRREGFGFDFIGGPIPYITEYLFQFIGARDEAGPSNYAEIEVQHKEFGAMTLTLQRRSGKTPHQLRQEAVEALQSSEAQTQALRGALEWRPIETYKGHVGALVSRPSDEYYYEPLSAFMDATGVWRILGSKGGMTKLRFEPTHWQPLPRPPTLSSQKGEGV